MESPVRICLGAAVVVHLLLLCSTVVRVNALPPQSQNATTSKVDKPVTSRITKLNGTTWTTRGRQRNADVSLNELTPKDSVSEEHTEAKNAKYKDRGRIKFHTSTQSSTSTVIPRRVIRTSTTGPRVTIVTPTPEKKNITQILDSMREYKKTKKIPATVSSTTPLSVADKDNESEDEEDEDEDEEELEEDEDYKDKYSYEPHSSSTFHERDNFFTIPGFSDDDEFIHDSEKANTVPKSYSVPTYDSFPSYFPKDISYSPPSESYSSDSFFRDFEMQLTTPRNDFFDKKFKTISNSIMSNLASIRAQTQETNKTNTHKVLKGNVNVENLFKGVPTNKSTVIIKNTKEIRLLDNDKAGTDNKELSDVHGTSIYYEMSVLSTETYAIDQSNEDDCDNDTLSFEPTPSTPSDKEIASMKTSHENLILLPTKELPSASSKSPAIYSSKIPSSTTSTSTSTIATTAAETTPQSKPVTTTARSTQKNFSSSYRNRGYSKRISFTNNKDYPNSVTSKPDEVTQHKPVTRRIQYTTPKIKPIWMAPRRNFTRNSYTKTTYPTTIYAEHFNIKDSFNSKNQNKTSLLTTVSSDNIDPILQSDVGASKKVVHSQTISDNSIPQLRKRGSMKFSAATTVSSEVETETDIMEIPPTLTAWALASLRSPPSQSSSVVNNTASTQTIDEEHLQSVDISDKESPSQRKQSPSTSTSTTPNTVNTEFTQNKIYEIDQNKLPWKPVHTELTSDTKAQTESSPTENKSERLPAESTISLLSSIQPTTSQAASEANVTDKEVTTSIPDTTESMTWVQVTKTEAEELTTEETSETTVIEKKIPNIHGFESITKLPSGITTPQSDDSLPPIGTTLEIVNTSTEPVTEILSTMPTTDDYEITTIRFTYSPKSKDFTTTPIVTTDSWHPVTTVNIIEDTPITTYRPKYMTTTELNIAETTTVVPETTPVQILNKEIEDTTFFTTIAETEVPVATEIVTHPIIAPIESTTEIETTTIIVQVVTEINTERETLKPTTERATETSKPSTEAAINLSENPIDSSSEENSGSNEVISHIRETSTTPSEITTSGPAYVTVNPISSPSTQPPLEPTETTDEDIQTKDSTTESTEVPTNYEDNEKKTIIELSTAMDESFTQTTDEMTTRSINMLEDLSSYADMTTEASSRVLDEAGSGAAIAIAVSTIGVIALVLLVGLLLVVRKRGRRGMYAQRCTPVSLDAYSLDSVSVGHRKGNQRLRASKRSYGNPAYDDEVTSHPMQYAALANFAMDIDSIVAEFAEIPSVTVRPDDVPPGCEDKNRYSNVLPLPETRVPLQRIGNDPTTEYINANFITGPGNIKNYYIACQAPLPNTVVDFWRMIWEQNSRLVVMLTEYMENGVEKCYEYLPPSEVSDNKRTFGQFQVILKKREQRDKYALSSIQLINLDTRTWREVVQLWYFWPPKGVPDDYNSVLDFLSEMRSYMKISQTAKEYDEEGVEVIYGSDSRSSFHNLSKFKSEENGSGNGVNVYSPQRAEEQMRRGAAVNGTLGRMKAASEIEGVRPCVVACASGAGRSAALVALDVCARALAAAGAGARVDVPRVVRELRAQRPHSLANKHHYIFLYKVLSEYGNKIMGGGVDAI